jgi:hypothetical protein
MISLFKELVKGPMAAILALIQKKKQKTFEKFVKQFLFLISSKDEKLYIIHFPPQ